MTGEDVVEPLPFVATTEKVELPAVVGVPEIAPVAELSVRPAGRVPEIE